MTSVAALTSKLFAVHGVLEYSLGQSNERVLGGLAKQGVGVCALGQAKKFVFVGLNPLSGRNPSVNGSAEPTIDGLPKKREGQSHILREPRLALARRRRTATTTAAP